MESGRYGLARFVGDLRAIAAEPATDGEIVRRLRPLVRELAGSPEWVERRHYECDPVRGFGVHVLHEEADHRLWIVAFSWLPGRGAPPHNHGTWAVVAGVEGPEKNVYWRRMDDGSRPGHARLEPMGEEIVGPGDVVAMLPDAIHSVVNESDRVSLSLHVYGWNTNVIGRSQFDPEKQTEKPFVLSLE